MNEKRKKRCNESLITKANTHTSNSMIICNLKCFFFYEELFFFVHRLDRVNYRIKNKKIESKQSFQFEFAFDQLFIYPFNFYLYTHIKLYFIFLYSITYKFIYN